MTFAIRFFFCLSFIFFSAISAAAQESITSFLVDIDAKQNGDLMITETISVNVKGRQVRRGILRELPRYQLYQGKEIPIRYKVRSVDRNDDKEPFVIERVDNFYVLKIGDADVFLKHRLHKYEISYLIKDELRRFDTHDEIYWNVTGNDWRLPIDYAVARVTVPEGANLQEVDFYTGSQGSQGKDAVYTNKGDFYEIATSREFKVKEGLTISLSFDKGVFGDVQPSTKRYILRLRFGAILLLSLSFLGIAGYYYRSWNKVGRDPVKGPVFAQYEPPEGYSAAATSYIYFRGIKGHKALIATLMGLSTKNWISIETDKKQTILTPLDRELLDKDDTPSPFALTREAFTALLSGDKKRIKDAGLELMIDDDLDEPIAPSESFAKLNPEEAQLFARLFPKVRKVPLVLNKKTNSDFHTAQATFQGRLQRLFGEAYYSFNIGYIMLGIFASIVAVVISLSQASNLTPKWLFALIAALIIFNLIFIYLMPAPTKKGQKIRTEIEGFRLYLKTAEEQKFDSVKVGSDQPPPMSVNRYEQLLPYAIALGVEDPWSRYFENIMPVEAKEYASHWNGSGRNFGSISDMTENMISNISSGVSASAPQSSSSSAGGGGGFSGGGGGGGGGGGW